MAKKTDPTDSDKPKTEVRKFRLMHGKHSDGKKTYEKGDVVDHEVPVCEDTDPVKVQEHKDKHDLSKQFKGPDNEPRFVEFKDGDKLPSLKPDPSSSVSGPAGV